MPDREKVIRGLERFIDDFKPFCGNRDDWQRVYDALAMLKEQEARVMTKKEAECDCPDCVYFETRTGWWECTIKDEGESDRYFGVFVYGCNDWFMRSYEEYGKTWRCWTSRPSPEQMRATPWEGEDGVDKTV